MDLRESAFAAADAARASRWLRPLRYPLVAGLLLAALLSVVALSVLWNDMGKRINKRSALRLFVYATLASCAFTFVHYRLVMADACATASKHKQHDLLSAIEVHGMYSPPTAPAVAPALTQPAPAVSASAPAAPASAPAAPASAQAAAPAEAVYARSNNVAAA